MFIANQLSQDIHMKRLSKKLFKAIRGALFIGTLSRNLNISWIELNQIAEGAGNSKESGLYAFGKGEVNKTIICNSIKNKDFRARGV